MMNLDVLGIGAWSTSHRDWPALAAICRGRAIAVDAGTTRPSPMLLPPAERRRAPDGVAVALEVASEAVAMSASKGIDPTSLASVFTSAHGDLAIVDYLCAALASDPTSVSPTRFHLSVHNAAAGHWSIAAMDRAPSTALAAGDDSFALGLLEAATMAVAEQRAVLLVAFDTPAVGLLAQTTHSTALFGFALVLRASDRSRTDAIVHMTLSLETVAEVDGPAEATSMPMPFEPALQALAASSAAAKAMALAEALAIDGRTELRYPLGGALALSIVTGHRIDSNEDARDATIK